MSQARSVGRASTVAQARPVIQACPMASTPSIIQARPVTQASTVRTCLPTPQASTVRSCPSTPQATSTARWASTRGGAPRGQQPGSEAAGQTQKPVGTVCAAVQTAQVGAPKGQRQGRPEAQRAKARPERQRGCRAGARVQAGRQSPQAAAGHAEFAISVLARAAGASGLKQDAVLYLVETVASMFRALLAECSEIPQPPGLIGWEGACGQNLGPEWCMHVGESPVCERAARHAPYQAAEPEPPLSLDRRAL